MKDYYGDELPEEILTLAEFAVSAADAMEAAGLGFGNEIPYHTGGGYFIRDGTVRVFATGDELPDQGPAPWPEARMSVETGIHESPFADFSIVMNG